MIVSSLGVEQFSQKIALFEIVNQAYSNLEQLRHKWIRQQGVGNAELIRARTLVLYRVCVCVCLLQTHSLQYFTSHICGVVTIDVIRLFTDRGRQRALFSVLVTFGSLTPVPTRTRALHSAIDTLAFPGVPGNRRASPGGKYVRSSHELNIDLSMTQRSCISRMVHINTRISSYYLQQRPTHPSRQYGTLLMQSRRTGSL